MNKLLPALVACLSLPGGVALADVSDSAPAGFTTVNEVLIEAPKSAVWHAATEQVGRWWSSDHTVSGDAGRLKITAETQGCFCEQFETGGGVVHMTVTMVNPGVVIRLTGGLGPLGLMGVDGNMTWEFEEQGDATSVKLTYAVGGYRPGGLDAIAAPVDGVLADALSRLQRFVETGTADSGDTGQ